MQRHVAVDRPALEQDVTPERPTGPRRETEPDRPQRLMLADRIAVDPDVLVRRQRCGMRVQGHLRGPAHSPLNIRSQRPSPSMQPG